jgi:hypothetical protein
MMDAAADDSHAIIIFSLIFNNKYIIKYINNQNYTFLYM